MVSVNQTQRDMVRILVKVIVGLLVVLAAYYASAQVRFDAITVSTNQSPYDFTAAGLGAVWHPAVNCQVVTFTISGDPGEYVLQWCHYLGGPWLTVYNEFAATAKDRQDAVNPSIVLHNQPVTFSFPMIKPDTFPAPKTGFFRLKKR